MIDDNTHYQLTSARQWTPTWLQEMSITFYPHHALAWGRVLPEYDVRLSVRPSVRLPGVTSMYADHIGRATSNLILLDCKISVRGTSSNLGSNRGGVGKNGALQPISHHISETARDRATVTNDHQQEVAQALSYETKIIGLGWPCTWRVITHSAMPISRVFRSSPWKWERR